MLDQAEASFWSPNDQKGLSEVIWPPRNWQGLDEQLQTELRRTNIAQPAIGATSLGMYRILEGLGIQGRSLCRALLWRTHGPRRGQ